MDYDTPIMENLHYHAYNYRNAHSTQATNDFNTLEEFVSKLGIAAGEKWREEWREVCNENQVLINRNQALLEALKEGEKTIRWIDHPSVNKVWDKARVAIKLAEGNDV